jgi:response regulator NasT
MPTSGPRTTASAPPPNGTAARRSLGVLVADPDPAARDLFQKALAALGHQPHLAETGRQAIDLCRAAPPDVLIVDTRLPDAEGIELAAAVCRERPVAVVLAAAEPDAAAVWAAAECPVLGYLAKPFRPEALAATLAAAVRTFERVQSLGHEAEVLRQTLEDRKLIERAKGLLMRFAGVSEDDAYRRMRGLATRGSRKVVEVAREVIAAGDVLGNLMEDSSPLDGPDHAHGPVGRDRGGNGRVVSLRDGPRNGR